MTSASAIITFGIGEMAHGAGDIAHAAQGAAHDLAGLLRVGQRARLFVQLFRIEILALGQRKSALRSS